MTFNFAFYLSLVLAAAGCTGLILAGKGKWYGWGVGLAVQPVWAAYAIVTKGYGLLITCAMYGFVNARNLWKWRESQTQAKRVFKNQKKLYEWGTAHLYDEPVGKVTSMTEDENGLEVKWIQNEHTFVIPKDELDQVGSIHSYMMDNIKESLAMEDSKGEFNYNPIAGTKEYWAKDFAKWQTSEDVLAGKPLQLCTTCGVNWPHPGLPKGCCDSCDHPIRT